VADEIIGGFRLLKVLYTGQTSQVWEVVELASHRHFAMKLLLPEYTGNPERRRGLLHEAEVGLKVTHPNVINILSVVKDKLNPFYLMEFFPAGSLKFRIMRKQVGFIREHGKEILLQAAAGLGHMNARGWVHCDVKPDNILVNSLVEVRIIDFGLAQPVRKRWSGFFSRRKLVQGTRSYMSPEQIRGEPLDGRADIYSFGATAYELAAGRPPFRGATSQDLLNKQLNERPISPRVHNPDITDEFSDLVLRMQAKKPDDRPQSFDEVRLKLRGIRMFKGQPLQRTSL
jgi:serine/threonine protein kinase